MTAAEPPFQRCELACLIRVTKIGCPWRDRGGPDFISSLPRPTTFNHIIESVALAERRSQGLNSRPWQFDDGSRRQIVTAITSGCATDRQSRCVIPASGSLTSIRHRPQIDEEWSRKYRLMPDGLMPR